MSQDLFAAFGSPNPESQNKPTVTANASSFSFFDDFNSTPASNSASPKTVKNAGPIAKQSRPEENFEVDLDEDAWGDFEEKKDEFQPSTALPIASQFSRWLDDEDDGFPDYEIPTQAPGATWDFTKPDPPAPPKTTAKMPTKPKPGPVLQQRAPAKVIPRKNSVPQPRDPNVLFDAENEEFDDEEFGDFEEATNEAPPQQPTGAFDLLGMDALPSVMPQKTTVSAPAYAPTSSLLDLEDLSINDNSASTWAAVGSTPTVQPVHGFGTLGALSKPKPENYPDRSPSPTRKPQSSMAKPVSPVKSPGPAPPVDDQWDDFEAWEEGSSTLETEPKVQPTLSVPPPLTSDASTSSLKTPPTNIPPPALVISLFSPLFTSAESSFFRPLRQESQDVQHAIYCDPATTSYLKGLLALATVCGRVIAGRKQRWKRDTILAQAMRIGPSAAGGVSGLKLTSIDKAETTREDREAADALRAWQTHVGKLKSAIAEVKRLKGLEIGKIPDLKDVMPIKVAKEIEGGLKGNRPCALCGLKREERVGKVDFEVEDSFGEWWVEDVSMHRACRNFWDQHKESLRQR